MTKRIAHFISLADITSQQLRAILDKAYELRGRRCDVLRDRTLAMLFEKPSLRTRVSFEQAMVELGGHAIVIRQDEVGLGSRESIADVARVLGGMVQGIAARVFEHARLTELARHAGVPVVNMLSDDAHPVQVLADAMVLIDEFCADAAPGAWDLSGRKLAWIGDGNNVARSLAHLCQLTGMTLTIASPKGYELPDAAALGAVVAGDPTHAVADADAVFTDTFVSMGLEAQKQQRLDAFRDYQVNEALMAAAPPHAIVLHCLPAYRGIEITDGVIDGPRSRVFPEAHNRLHAQKGLLALMLA